MPRQSRPRDSAMLPASLRALLEKSREMLRMIDDEKARCFVQQATNGHGEDDVFARDGDGNETTYAQRMKELEQSEKRLRESLPPKLMKIIQKERDAEEPTVEEE